MSKHRGADKAICGCLEPAWFGTYTPQKKEMLNSRWERSLPVAGASAQRLLQQLDALIALLPEMASKIPIDHALIRGRYTAVARMNGWDPR